jgi:hypothetical protein
MRKVPAHGNGCRVHASCTGSAWDGVSHSDSWAGETATEGNTQDSSQPPDYASSDWLDDRETPA